jgi:nucleotidyltransferase/DNA polymerase involved in DNA repair
MSQTPNELNVANNAEQNLEMAEWQTIAETYPPVMEAMSEQAKATLRQRAWQQQLKENPPKLEAYRETDRQETQLYQQQIKEQRTASRLFDEECELNGSLGQRNYSMQKALEKESFTTIPVGFLQAEAQPLDLTKTVVTPTFSLPSDVIVIKTEPGTSNESQVLIIPESTSSEGQSFEAQMQDFPYAVPQTASLHGTRHCTQALSQGHTLQKNSDVIVRG